MTKRVCPYLSRNTCHVDNVFTSSVTNSFCECNNLSYHIGNIAGYSIGDLLWEGHVNFRYEKTVEQKRASKVSIRNVLHICVNEETVGIVLLSFVEKAPTPKPVNIDIIYTIVHTVLDCPLSVGSHM